MLLAWPVHWAFKMYEVLFACLSAMMPLFDAFLQACCLLGHFNRGAKSISLDLSELSSTAYAVICTGYI